MRRLVETECVQKSHFVIGREGHHHHLSFDSHFYVKCSAALRDGTSKLWWTKLGSDVRQRVAFQWWVLRTIVSFSGGHPDVGVEPRPPLQSAFQAGAWALTGVRELRLIDSVMHICSVSSDNSIVISNLECFSDGRRLCCYNTRILELINNLNIHITDHTLCSSRTTTFDKHNMTKVFCS